MLEARDDPHVNPLARNLAPHGPAAGILGSGASPGPDGSPVPRSRGHVALADFDPELLEAVGSADRDRARRALMAPAYRLAPGPVDVPLPGLPEATFALLVLRGSLIHETQAGAGRMITFVSDGELLMPFGPDASAQRTHVSVRAADEVLIAALEHRFIRAAAVWPGLMRLVARRLGEQQHRLALHGAICQLPRVEQRLMALMWLLADRSGKVTAEGVVVSRALNHRALADLIGARRPTVTLALKALREQGHLERRPDGTWLLSAREQPAGSFAELIGHLPAGATC